MVSIRESRTTGALSNSSLSFSSRALALLPRHGADNTPRVRSAKQGRAGLSCGMVSRPCHRRRPKVSHEPGQRPRLSGNLRSGRVNWSGQTRHNSPIHGEENKCGRVVRASDPAGWYRSLITLLLSKAIGIAKARDEIAALNEKVGWRNIDYVLCSGNSGFSNSASLRVSSAFSKSTSPPC